MRNSHFQCFLVAVCGMALLLPHNAVASDVLEPPHAVSSFTAATEARYPFRENMYEPLTLPDGRIVAL